MMKLSPVFVVGSPRSGTSILILSLRRVGYKGFSENNFLTAASFLGASVDRFFTSYYTPNPHLLISKIDKEDLKLRISRVIIEACIEQQPSHPWMDKSGGPKVISMIPLLREALPTSRFIFAKRRPIENIVSRLVKFPKPTFEYHCSDWAETMAAWRTLKVSNPGDHLFEIDQREISTTPMHAASRIGKFLELDETETSALATSFSSNTPQQTEVGSAKRTLSLQETGWTDEQKEIFERICGAEMAAEGYSTDDAYRSGSETV